MKKSHVFHRFMAVAIVALLPITVASGRGMGPGMGHHMGGPGMGPHMGGPRMAHHMGGPGMGPRFFNGNGFHHGHEFAFRHHEFGHFRDFDRDDRFFRHHEFGHFHHFHDRDRFFFAFNFVGPGFPYPYGYPWYPWYPWYPYWWY